MQSLRKLLLSLGLINSLVTAQNGNGSHGPPPDTDPLTWGFYGEFSSKLESE